MNLGDRKARRMMDRMGINMKEMPDVEEVIIKTSSKELHIRGAQVSEINAQGNRIFQVMGEVEEVERALFEPPPSRLALLGLCRDALPIGASDLPWSRRWTSLDMPVLARGCKLGRPRDRMAVQERKPPRSGREWWSTCRGPRPTTVTIAAFQSSGWATLMVAMSIWSYPTL